MLKNALYLLASMSFASIPLQTIQLHSSETAFISTSSSESERLSTFLEDFFKDLQKLSPEFATYVGTTKAYNASWTDHSEIGYFLRHQIMEGKLQRLHTIDRQALSLVDQLNYDLIENELESSLSVYIFQTHYMPLDQFGGIPLEVESIFMMAPRDSFEDYENLLSRLSGIPTLIGQTLALLEVGLEKGLTPPQIVLKTLPGSIAKMIPLSIKDSVFFQPFLEFPDCIDQVQQDQIIQKALEIIEGGIYPVYQKLLKFLENVYIPSCRKSVGICDLPNGPDLYQFNVKRHTTTDLTPSEIHQIGLNEVARIETEMQTILDRIQFSGSLADYFHYLNTSSEFFYTKPEELIEGYRRITSYIDGQLPLLFGRLPKLPYEVVPVPAFAEEGQVGAYYMRGSLTTGRPGRFYANTYAINTRPKWEMESLSLHEAVPGHHFQISIAQEIEGLPEFRRYNNYTAYIEGWGLYSESLGKELGLYLAPSDQFGRLVAEIWRSVRLVVDTGIHALGWTREESIDYMMEKTGMGRREVTTEIDRYIVWPGQALAYKIGELSIQKWRREATEALGDSFDIRAFHDMLLEQGALPLDICENYVHGWIEAQKATL